MVLTHNYKKLFPTALRAQSGKKKTYNKEVAKILTAEKINKGDIVLQVFNDRRTAEDVFGSITPWALLKVIRGILWYYQNKMVISLM